MEIVYWLLLQDWDYSLVQVSNTGLDYVDYLPFKLDAEAYETDYRVMSDFDLSDNEDVDIMSSFENISPRVLVLYMVWFVVAYVVNIALKKVLLSLSVNKTKYTQSYLWHIVRVACTQCHSNFELYSFRAMETALAISIFYLVQYYNGNYSTEFTVRLRPKVIDNLEQLVVSGKPAVFLEGDPIILYLNISSDPTERKIIDRVEFDSKGKSSSMVSNSRTVPPLAIAGKIREENGAAIVAYVLRESVEYFYCQQHLADTKDKDKPSEPSLHNSDELFYETMFFNVFHPNISSKLASRLHTHLRRVSETKLFSSLIVGRFLNILLGLMGEKPTREVTECMNHAHGASNEQVHALRPVHLRMVLYVGMSAIFVAICELVAEVCLELKKKKRKRKLLRIRKITVWPSQYSVGNASKSPYPTYLNQS
ncbi:hypothetical protein HDE_02033 [Halotydeus destructor]|nr:hypothetical protein HDE_02033 [Halotydeus destructor]